MVSGVWRDFRALSKAYSKLNAKEVKMSRYLEEKLYISYFNGDYNGDCHTDSLE